MPTHESHQELSRQIEALIDGEPDLIANLSNVSAVLNNALDNINWVGFYFCKGQELVLGPFQGNPACVRIPMGKGVCGVSAQTQKTLRIKDVHEFDGHIACDAASNSELVVPIVVDGTTVAVLDIDSPSFGRFSEEDQWGMESVVKVITRLWQL